MTENAVFAMPEVGIGFFPDVGGSYLLPRLKGSSFGMYLGLTGNKIRIWRRAVVGHRHPRGRSRLPAGDRFEEIAEAATPARNCANVFRAPRRETDEGALRAIAKHFSREKLAAGHRHQPRARRADRQVRGRHAGDHALTRSPTSLHVTFRAITAGSTMSMDECMRMEFRILNRMLPSHDLYEGIRAALIDKDSVPNWQPARLDDVDAAAVDAYFAPLPDGELAAVTDLEPAAGPLRPTLTEQAFVWFQRHDRRLLPAVRRPLLGAADRPITRARSGAST